MLVETLREIVFPNKCMICGKLLAHPKEPFCNACEEHIYSQAACKRCGKLFAEVDTCPYCEAMPEGVTRIRALFPYVDFYKESVLRWKYKGVRKYRKGYAKLIAQMLLQDTTLHYDAIVPVPIAPNRYEVRGFNQAGDLAREIGVLTSKPVYDLLRRTKRTKPQSACTKQERLGNVSHTMQMTAPLPSAVHTILLVDDIYTTGSTVRECIRAINAQGSRGEWLQFVVFVVCMG